MTKKWIEVNDLSSGKYSVNKYIRFKTSMLKSDLCHYSDAYFVKERMSATGTYNVNRRNKKITFKENRKKIRPLDIEKKVIAQPRKMFYKILMNARATTSAILLS